jgi:predicted phosphoribosyltransferase
VAAVPVGAAETCAAMADEADESICAREPETVFMASDVVPRFLRNEQTKSNNCLLGQRATFPNDPQW